MKKFLPILLLFLMIGALALLIIGSSASSTGKRRLDGRLAIGKISKKPYGHYVAYSGLSTLFQKAAIIPTGPDDAYLDSLQEFSTGNALVIITDQFNPTEKEMGNLMRFASYGNTIFLSTRSISYQVEKTLSVTLEEEIFPYYDSLTVDLNSPPFSAKQSYTYPGYRFASPAHSWNDSLVDILATADERKPLLFRYHAGGGNIFLHLAPLSLSNYFLLHKKNLPYYEQLFSLIPSTVQNIYWDEYFSQKTQNNQQPNPKQANWWTVMMRYPSMKAALWIALLTLIVYVLLEMRRRRRQIPVLPMPRNDSLDFVRTIGRLYHERGDHRNLCIKMGSYFLEHVRNRYRVTTTRLDDELVKTLHFKSGYPEPEIRYILTFIAQLEKEHSVSVWQLQDFYQQLEKFYKQA